MTRRYSLSICALLAALFLSGCLDYDEDLTLFGNGSGTFALTLTVDEQVLANAPEDIARRFSPEEAKREFEKLDGVKLDHATATRANGRQTLHLDGSFRSLPELAARGDNAAPGAASFLGKLSYQEDGRRLRLSRVIDLGGAGQLPGFGGSAGDALAQGFMAAMFNGHALTFRAHFPSQIVNANAARLDPKTGTVEWVFPLAAALREPPVMTVELLRPNPLVPWLVGALLLVPVGYTAWRLFGRGESEVGGGKSELRKRTPTGEY